MAITSVGVPSCQPSHLAAAAAAAADEEHRNERQQSFIQSHEIYSRSLTEPAIANDCRRSETMGLAAIVDTEESLSLQLYFHQRLFSKGKISAFTLNLYLYFHHRLFSKGKISAFTLNLYLYFHQRLFSNGKISAFTLNLYLYFHQRLF